jgi:ABC-type branched-subunit amino acid transport system substrate-binding protein
MARAARGGGGRLTIGQSAALSGPSSRLGYELQTGIEAAFDQINKDGGIHDNVLVLSTLDDGFEPARAVSNTARLVEECIALVGYVGTATTAASLPLIAQARIPLVGPYSGSRDLRDPVNPFVFNVRASYEDEAVRLVKLLTSLRGSDERIGIVYQDDAYGVAVKDAVQSALSKLGLAPVAYGTIKLNSLDVDEAANSMVKARVTGVALGSVYAASAAVMAAIRKQGVQPQFASVSFVGTSGLAELHPEDAFGIGISQVMPHPWIRDIGLIRDFHTAMGYTAQAKSGQSKITYGALEGYVLARVLAEGLQRAGRSPTRAGLRTALEGLNIDLGGFKVAFSPTSHQGSSFTDITVVGKDGRIRR